jgi:ribosome-binding factor A
VEILPHRLARVAEVIREVASETILYELRDPRVRTAQVTITRAEVSGDLQHAKIFVSVMGTPKEQELCMHGLRSAAGFVQSKLAERLQTRFTPVLSFVLDQGVKKSIEMTRLINEALGQAAPGDASRADDAIDDEVDDDEPGATDGTVEEEPRKDEG